MNTKILNSQLDFDTLKNNIKSYLSQSSEFADYDFDASGLNVLIDALAYNTHQLAKIANFTLNESFLDTAQLRPSIVSHAKSLGYIPKSTTSSRAVINVAVNNVPSGTGLLTLPKYSQFSTSIDGETFKFYTLEEYTTDSTQDYVFENVEIVEGNLRTKKFFIDGFESTYPVYVIPETNIDTTTLSVLVREGVGSSNITSLVRATEIAELDQDSEIYLINETPNGNWELTIGDNVIGWRPEDGSILEATYLVSNGSFSNNASIFTTSETVLGRSLTITLVTKSFGGLEKETIESIRFNAPLNFLSQNRLVTENDYLSYINNNISFIDTINVWGGAENNPPVYGKVFISIKPIGAETMTEAQELAVSQLLSKKTVLNITPEFVDPVYDYLEISATVRYDGRKTSLTKAQLETFISDITETFNEEKLISFSSIFRKSNLLTEYDNSNIAILSSNATVKIRRRFFPTIGARDSYELTFGNTIRNPSTSVESVVTSTGFTYTDNGIQYTTFIKNEEGQTNLILYRFSGGNEIVLSDNIGQIDIANNRICIGPIQPTAFLNADKGIEIIVELSNDNIIMPVRNNLITIDMDALSVNAINEA